MLKTPYRTVWISKPCETMSGIKGFCVRCWCCGNALTMHRTVGVSWMSHFCFIFWRLVFTPHKRELLFLSNVAKSFSSVRSLCGMPILINVIDGNLRAVRFKLWWQQWLIIVTLGRSELINWLIRPLIISALVFEGAEISDVKRCWWWGSDLNATNGFILSLYPF